jgi:hypothetical protein
MKKIMLMTLAVLLSVSAMAKVKVKSGSTDCLKENATAVIEFDYSEATFDEDESYITWCGEDFAKRDSLSTADFIGSFNRNSKGLQINNEASDAKYRIVVKVGDCDQSMDMGCSWGEMRFKCSAMITIVEIATNEVVCTVEVDEEEGLCDYVPNDRIASCYRSIAKELAKKK